MSSEVDGYDFANTLTEEKGYLALTGARALAGRYGRQPAGERYAWCFTTAVGQVIRKVTVTAADNWSYRFENIPKYDAGGDEISYSCPGSMLLTAIR